MMFYVARCKRTGFTLIEIMIVIAIIAILAGIVVPNISMARFEAQLVACQKNCQVALEAVQMVRIRCGSWSSVAEKLGGGYSSQSYSLGGGRTNSMESCTIPRTGLVDGLIEEGYLGKVLRCPWAPVPISTYAFLHYAQNGDVADQFSRDWLGKDKASIRDTWTYVYDNYAHKYGGRTCKCASEESIGMCFIATGSV